MGWQSKHGIDQQGRWVVFTKEGDEVDTEIVTEANNVF
jgi:hypothetical protein